MVMPLVSFLYISVAMLGTFLSSLHLNLIFLWVIVLVSEEIKMCRLHFYS